ncbi:helix-turn-helix domain-containing protein [Microbacterium sp. 1.5R]|uniref:helix-turn-helix domain-containing protein n=1 Tax=Microbacterium sp. 1.5R TaxID=1916917 RepID=UPI0011A5332A|nr:AraC family transcriptional regulator [Microbacterium sp. 1.5R]
MQTTAPSALARVLDGVDLTVGVARRVTMRIGERLSLPVGAAALVYIAEGTVHGHPPLNTGCRLDVDRASTLIAVDERPADTALTLGDAFLTLGRTAFSLQASEQSDVVVFDLEFSPVAESLVAALPDPVTVIAFDALEPAAAALAGSMGPTDPPGSPARQGDPLICRMMAKTVLLSVIRAWAANGCAPEGWPTASRDPFLDRVVEAIHDQPGREWTVESLASVGAMSRSAFAERFRLAIGRSPADYVTEVRIDAAKGMLAAGRTVSETSRELGYASDEGFSRAFRRRTGMTPSAWRASQRTPVPA